MLLAEHGEAIEADLAHHYHVALADLATGALSFRRLAVLIRHLPATSALSRAVHGETVDWGPTEHLLALVADLLAWANYQRNRGKGPKPKPVPRPGDADDRTHHGRAVRSPHETAAYLAAFQPEEVTHGD